MARMESFKAIIFIYQAWLLLLRYGGRGGFLFFSCYCTSSAELLSRYVGTGTHVKAHPFVCLSVCASCTNCKQDNGLRLILTYQTFNYILEEMEISVGLKHHTYTV